MRAYVLRHYGDPEGSLLMDVPAPASRPSDILVEVRAAGLNPVDFKFRQGKLRAILRPKLPFVLGNELAGEVIAIGSDVKRFRVGDRVFARVAKDRAGAFAEQACVSEDDAALMPRNLDFTAAAAVPLAGLTALQALRDELAVKPGQNVFISGGAGGVGTFAIQIAKWLGAHVTTTASKRGEALVRSLGCDEVIDYTAQDISKAGRRFDAGRPDRRQNPGANVRNHEAWNQDRFSSRYSRTANCDQGLRWPPSACRHVLGHQLRYQIASSTRRDQLSISFHASKR
jgi:alcohol dehydrogenase